MKQIDQFTALNLEYYKGVYSVIEGYVNKYGDFKTRWVTEEFGKDKTPKTTPKRVKLGDKAKAIEVCLWMYKKLTGKEFSEEDAPF